MYKSTRSFWRRWKGLTNVYLTSCKYCYCLHSFLNTTWLWIGTILKHNVAQQSVLLCNSQCTQTRHNSTNCLCKKFNFINLRMFYWSTFRAQEFYNRRILFIYSSIHNCVLHKHTLALYRWTYILCCYVSWILYGKYLNLR